MYHFIKSQFRFFKFIYWNILRLGYKFKILSIYNIPIIINNFNRLTHPLQLIEFLENCGFTNIVMLDNNSTYPPLLKFYNQTKHKIIRMGFNFGHLALWKSNLYKNYKWNYFVYTDSDVVPIDECPKNFIDYFRKVLDQHYQLDKIGFGIKIDDLPNSFSLKERVVAYERRYWEKEFAPTLYQASIDTTFALYKPLSNLKNDQIYTLFAVRTGFPYLLRHLPWYADSKNLTEEEQYYIQTCNNSSSLGKHQGGEENVY